MTHAQDKRSYDNTVFSGEKLSKGQVASMGVDDKILYGQEASMTEKEKGSMTAAQWKKSSDTSVFLGEKLSKDQISHMGVDDKILYGYEDQMTKQERQGMTPAQKAKSEEVKAFLGEDGQKTAGAEEISGLAGKSSGFQFGTGKAAEISRTVGGK